MPLRVEHLSIRLTRWDSAGPYRMSQEGLRAIDNALEHISETVQTLASRMVDYVPSLRALTMNIGRREARFMRMFDLP